MNRVALNEIQDIEIIVAQNIKKHRLQRCISQKQLASCIGVSIQQVQKYEKSINRISSGKLFRIACLLKMPIHKFFKK